MSRVWFCGAGAGFRGGWGFVFFSPGPAPPDAPPPPPRPAGATAATLAAEARHRRSLSAQAGQHVIQLRQFDLQLAFAAPRMTRENIENQLGAVDHPTFGGFLDVSLLHRSEEHTSELQSPCNLVCR